jgi:hypothetical protein
MDSNRYLIDLAEQGTLHGRPATPQDYQDAIRALAQIGTNALADGDLVTSSLASLGMRALIRRQRKPVVRRGEVVGYREPRAASAPELLSADRVLVTDLAGVPY